MKHGCEAAESLVLVRRRLLCPINQEEISFLFFQFDLSMLINHLGDDVIFLGWE